MSYHSIPVDWISFVLFLWNFFAVGMVGLVVLAETASNLNRAFLLAIAMSVVSGNKREDAQRSDHAISHDQFDLFSSPFFSSCPACWCAVSVCLQSWPFMEFPEWTVWTTLVVLTVYGQRR